ncbi:MAG TPA: DUF2007 domain-containing protein [Acidobacteriaceae bacterium]|jgi:hypothetical protein
MSETNEDALRQMFEDGAGGPIENLVTIATFPDPAEASIARSALEGSGILSFLQGENANVLIPVAFTARLQVRAEDEVAAREVLGAAEVAPLSEEGLEEAQALGEDPSL